MLAAAGATTEMLGATSSTPQLLACLHRLTERTQRYFESVPALSAGIRDMRLACEVAVIDTLAHKLLGVLKERDPLRDRVHLGKGTLLVTMIAAVAGTAIRRLMPGAGEEVRSRDGRSQDVRS
jgi:hypothetical protein